MEGRRCRCREHVRLLSSAYWFSGLPVGGLLQSIASASELLVRVRGLPAGISAVSFRSRQSRIAAGAGLHAL
eukprot:3056966-Alexandrium_andersonii.AAC.1